MLVNIDISGGDLREYVTSYRSVTFAQDGCKMRKKRGLISLDLSLYDVNKVSVHVKRIGGNGRLIISGNEYTVGSTVHQILDIDTNGEIELFRPQHSTGEIVLLGVSFLAEKEDDAVSIDWKSIIKQCGKYSCLRLIKGRLYASSGGYIESGTIKSIETAPPNSVTIDGEKIHFNSSCEITNIALKPTQGRVQDELYISRNPPTPIEVPQPTTDSGTTKRIISNSAEQIPRHNHQLPNFDDHILYDSLSVRNFKQFSTNSFSKEIRSNNQTYLLVRQKGHANAAMSQLRDNSEYICIINGKKLNGNGRLYVGASIDNNFMARAAEIVFGGNFTNKYVQIKAGPGSPSSIQRLHINMPENFCSGEILIQRIIVVENLGLERAKLGIEGNKYLPFSEVQRPDSHDAIFSANLDVNRRDDSVYATAKKYAFYPSIHGVSPIDNDIVGSIASNNISGIVWSSRIKPLFGNIRVGDLNSESSNDTLLISHMNHLRPARRIWIEPFDFGSKFCDNDVKAIAGADAIFSPSFSNVQYLTEKFGEKNIRLAHRPLPWVEPEQEKFFSNLEFVLTFERDRKDINQILSMWSSDFPRLVIVGARGSYPDFVIPLTEYYPYKKLLYLMKAARFILDLSENSDYHSSILDLANAMGKTMLSTNWYVLDKPTGIFIGRTDYKDGRLMPANDALKFEINRAMGINRREINDMSNHNSVFISQIKLLLSA